MLVPMGREDSIVDVYDCRFDVKEAFHLARLHVIERSEAQRIVEDLHEALGRRMAVSSLAPCPVEFTAAFVGMCMTQSCGKCTPCRVGLSQLKTLMDDVLDGVATQGTLKLIDRTALYIYLSADCAIGYEAAGMALEAISGFRDDFEYHVAHGCCDFHQSELTPCVSGCPAGVDIPGYIALVEAGRFTDAVRLIHKDNPLPVACGLICEHPCEINCRRGMVDDPLNIRGIKRYATDHMEDYTPSKAAPTGKRVAIVGGGPAGLSAAYYLALMGHAPTIFEQRSHLGGMMRYGIPSYRLPRGRFDEEIAWILDQGVEVEYDVSVGRDVPIGDLRRDYDAVYVAIGAHADRKVGLPGEDAEGVISAVHMLREIGDGNVPDFTGQSIAVIGGGNVAMDVSRSAVRAGADRVMIVYRRRVTDMTAQDEEIAGAVAEECELLDMHAPIGIEVEDGKVSGLRVQPQIIGPVVGGRPRPRDGARESFVIPCDKVLVAVGQTIDSAPFADYGLPTKRGAISAASDGEVEGFDGLFSGGDCVSGPATVIRAIAAGKVAARNIDKYLGFDHEIVLDVDIPAVRFKGKLSCARSNMAERDAHARKEDFELMERGLTTEEALQEASRCLRCDHFGFGAFRGGRVSKW